MRTATPTHAAHSSSSPTQVGSNSGSTGFVQRMMRGCSFEAQAAMLQPIQHARGNAGREDTAAVQRAASEGVATSGGALPHAAKIQKAFGRFDVGAVQAHTGAGATRATDAMGADAYASGDHVVFGKQPDLHTAAHEAAHVVQQRAGVSLDGGVGRAGDAYEQHADRVADAVVAGQSAEGLLGEMGGTQARAPRSVQRLGNGRPSVQRAQSNEFASFADASLAGLDPRTGLKPGQMAIVDDFANMIEGALATWSKQRGTPDLVFKRYTDVAIAFHTFRRNLMTDPYYALVQREAARRLQVGRNAAIVAEIRMFDPTQLGELARMLEVEDVEASHSYEFRALWGNGAGVSNYGAKAGVVAKEIAIRYTNNKIPGLSWTQPVHLQGFVLGFGISLQDLKGGMDGPPVAGGSATGPGTFETAQEQPRERYLPPSYFDGASFTSPSASAGANAGPMTAKKGLGGALLFDNGGERLMWNLPGNWTSLVDELELNVDQNTAKDIKEQGVPLNAGVDASNEFGKSSLAGELEFEAGEWAELKSVKATPNKDWVPLHFARIFFPRGSAELDAPDYKTISKVVDAIHKWDKKDGYRGSFFKVEVSGCHSQAWDSYDDDLRTLDGRRDEDGQLHGKDVRREGEIEGKKLIENYSLAIGRAGNARSEFIRALGAKSITDRLTTGVAASSQVVAPTSHEPLSTNPYGDQQEERSATILVSYQIFNPASCAPGHYDLNSLLKAWSP